MARVSSRMADPDRMRGAAAVAWRLEDLALLRALCLVTYVYNNVYSQRVCRAGIVVVETTVHDRLSYAMVYAVLTLHM